MTAFIYDATDDNFAELVLGNSAKGPVLLNYWSKKVGPCIRQYPVLEQLAAEHNGRFLLVNLNTDKYRALAREYGVASLPTLKLFIDGSVAATRHGYQDEGDLQRLLSRYLPRESDKALLQALKRYRGGDRQGAMTTLAQAILADPQNIRLPLGMARLLVDDERPYEARQLLLNMPAEFKDDAEAKHLRGHIGWILAVGEADAAELQSNITTDPDDHRSRYRLAALHALNERPAQALVGFFELLERAPEYDNGAARQAVLLLLSMLGERHPLTREYRKRMRNLP